MFYKHRRSSASTCHACIDANVHLFLLLLGHITLVSHHVSHVPISTNISQSCCPCYSHALTLIKLTLTHYLLMRRCPTLIPDTGTAPLYISCFIGRCITSTSLRSAPACIAAALPPSYHAPAQSALPPRCRNPDSHSGYYLFCSFRFFHNYTSSILYINPVFCPHSSNNHVILPSPF